LFWIASVRRDILLNYQYLVNLYILIQLYQ